MLYNLFTPLTPSARALTNMSTTLNVNDDRIVAAVRRKLSELTEREIDICLLHFVDARPQALIAQWLGLNRKTVVEHLESAMQKVPELLPLRKTMQKRAPRVRIHHLSQLPRGDRQRGPFNRDEL